MISLILPFPPSVNTYWRHPTKGKLAGRHLISEKGREYRAAVQYCIGLSKTRVKHMDGRLSVRIVANPPDRRQRDLDNMLKALLDALTHAGVWSDDGAIDSLSITRGEVKPPGYVTITVQQIDVADSGAICRGCGGSISQTLSKSTNI